VDLHIQVDPDSTVAEGHLIAEAAERAVCARFPEVADVLAHLEPYDDYQARKTAAENNTEATSQLPARRSFSRVDP
jgi:divalent metal cation (Fe/Co/Zn/Cd) transporter